MEIVRVKVYNRFDNAASGRLSNSRVSLLNQGGSTLKTYSIGDALNIAEFDINFDY